MSEINFQEYELKKSEINVRKKHFQIYIIDSAKITKPIIEKIGGTSYGSSTRCFFYS